MALVFGAVVESAIVLWAYRKGFSEFGQFTKLVTVLEGLFGVYAGQFIYSLFPKVSKGMRPKMR